jgi:acetyltransferase-like isoleucine patch superfamily enzyme
MTKFVKRASFLLPTFLRNILKFFFIKINRTFCRIHYVRLGRNAFLGSYFRIEAVRPYRAIVGPNTNVDEYNIWNANGGDIRIENDCWIGVHNILMGPVHVLAGASTGPGVRILGPRHAVEGYDAVDSGTETVIGKNAWISTNSIIMHGVSIGENSIVGPGSLVTRDVPDNSYVAGNPARDLTKMVSFGEQIKERGKK